MPKQCLSTGCEKNSHSSGYCPRHYYSWKRYGDPLKAKVKRVKCNFKKLKDYSLIELTNDKWAKCSNEDLEFLLQWVWRSHLKNNYWSVVSKDKKTREHLIMSRVIAKRVFGDIENKVVDHINRDPMDNRRENLRLATHSQNHMNSDRSHGSSRFKGVSLHACGKWITQICIDGKVKRSKLFIEEIDAARQYNEWAKELFGEFAYFNQV